MYKGLRLVTCVAHIVLMDKGVCMPESNKQQVHRILKYSIPSGFIYDSESSGEAWQDFQTFSINPTESINCYHGDEVCPLFV